MILSSGPGTARPALRHGCRCGLTADPIFWTGSGESDAACSGRHVWDPSNTRRDSHAAQNLNQQKIYSFDRPYGLSISIPKQVFNDHYPSDPKTFGRRLRKARMDAGLRIKELAEIMEVTQDTVRAVLRIPASSDRRSLYLPIIRDLKIYSIQSTKKSQNRSRA